MSQGFNCWHCLSEDLKYLRGPRAPSASFCNLTGAVPCSDEAKG